MSRLTIVMPNGEVRTNNTKCLTATQEILTKLASLEDVLEEFGIEDEKALRVYLRNLEYCNKIILEENKQLKERLSKAIVPKFEMGQEVHTVVFDSFLGERFNFEIISGKIDTIYIHDDNIITYSFRCRNFREEVLFATKSEAEQKLKELGEKK